MALIATAAGGKDFIPVPPGNHVGRCYQIIGLGTQKSEFQGKVRFAKKVMLAFELFGEDEDGQALVVEDGRPMTVRIRLTLSLNEKATMRSFLESWRGRAFTEDEAQGFDLGKLLGVYGLVNVTHTTREGRIYANIASVTPLPKAMRDHKPVPVNPDVLFDAAEPDMEVFEALSERMQETIRACQEWNKEKSTVAKSSGMAGMDDDIPF